MVSLNTIITIGGLGAAYLIFSRLGGGAGIGSAIGSQLGDFTGALGSGITQAVNRFGNLVETPQANEPEGYRLDPTETRDYDEYVNYEPQSTPQGPTPNNGYGETGDGGPAFIFPDSTPPYNPNNFMNQFTFTDRTQVINKKSTTDTSVITPPPAITYGAPLPPFAGTLEYVVKNMQGETRTATEEEKDYLQSYGIGTNNRTTRYS